MSGELIRFPVGTRQHDIEEAERKKHRAAYYAGELTADEFWELMHGKTRAKTQIQEGGDHGTT